jgi:50S ribosomal subunit-associated GTPase HflX
LGIDCTYAQNAEKDCAIILLVNKIDLQAKFVVSPKEWQALAAKHNLKIFEVSAKTGVGVEDAFNALIKMAAEKKTSSELYQIRSHSNSRASSHHHDDAVDLRRMGKKPEAMEADLDGTPTTESEPSCCSIQ